MHIVLLTPEFGGGTGGIGTSLATLARGLFLRGHRVTVVTRGPVDQSLRSQGYRVVRIPCARGHLARWVFRLVADMATWSMRPDVVHAPEWGAVAAALALASDIPIVTRLDTPSFLVREMNGRYRPTMAEALVERGERFQARRSRLVLPASSALAILVQRRWGLQDARIRILRYPVDLACLRSRETGPWPASIRPGGIVYIGRLEPRKGIDILVPLLVEALEQTSTQVTVIGGSAAGGHGHAATTIQEALTRFGDRVSLLGNLPHDMAMTILARADLVVVPSVWENSPMVVMEAMALGRSVVASSVGGIPELIEDGLTGFLVRGRRLAEWTRVVVPLLGDESLRRVVGQRARSAAEAWDVDVIAEQAYMLYEEAAR